MKHEVIVINSGSVYATYINGVRVPCDVVKVDIADNNTCPICCGLLYQKICGECGIDWTYTSFDEIIAVKMKGRQND